MTPWDGTTSFLAESHVHWWPCKYHSFARLSHPGVHKLGANFSSSTFSISLTASGYVYRNVQIHLHKFEGKTAAEHAAVMSEVWETMLIDPDELLPKHRYFT